MMSSKLLAIVLFGICLISPEQSTLNRFKLPEGGVLELTTNDKGQVTSVVYSGKPEWLVYQNDERSHWHKYTELKTVQILQMKVTKEMMEYIATLKTVIEVDVSAPEVIASSESLQPLGKMTWLKTLAIGANGDFKLSDWAFITGMKSLEDLSITRSKGIDIEFGKLNRLRYLQLSGISDTSAKQLRQLQDLETAHIGRLETPQIALTSLHGCEKLRSLSIDSESLTRSDVALIADMPHLEAVYLSGRSLESFSELSKLKNLKCLALRFGKYPMKQDEIDWEGLSKLRVLGLRFDEFPNSENWKFLEKLPQLESLEIKADVVKEGSMTPIKNHSHIQELRIGAIKLHEEDIDILAALPELRVVEAGNDSGSLWHSRAISRLKNIRLLLCKQTTQ